ncbi:MULTISPECIES: GspH/FimT family protein [Halomonadaceae]|jgi:type IV fimbrial biogenesis protein FimT|uniref:Type II secretion system protein H n=1 Tax=Vreelandella piezotolerans TaxID=2609667 RepID=A0ABQ6X9M7_9GAMM|nr:MULTISPECIES: GspH/FimT family protein [Halomonas]KAE8438708.1 prepilin-type N-terminal cleavage/methylation domain-containing protein [Halomonas piezotolerans]MCG7590443.1 GspH/FimT family protein [Halomonas sp. McD50-5]MCG7616555.1 GspH/FimT family protein [Halomonas sp. McD50-4]QJA25497.1 prepilin-type N-terminal cleavage/methylation domain-containing protein [Halomonas piezotolerans]
MLTARRSAHGFTLLELLVALALFATLATIAIPNFARIIQENRVVTTTNDYKIALSFARSEAVRRNQSVDLLPVAEGWDNGWEVQADEVVLRRWAQEVDDITIANAPERFTFNSQGRLVSAAFASQRVSVTLNEIGRCVRIEPSGISRVLTNRQACD